MKAIRFTGLPFVSIHQADCQLQIGSTTKARLFVEFIQGLFEPPPPSPCQRPKSSSGCNWMFINQFQHR